MNDKNSDITLRKAIHPTFGLHPGHGHRTETVDGVLIERDVGVPIRGSRTLYADVFRATGAKDVPAIICYAPFGKHPHIELKTVFAGSDIPFDKISKYTPFEVFDPLRWAQDGFAICIVDGVGNWYSQGTPSFFGQDEAEAGYDCVEWFAAQPWCNGKIGWGGVSYYAMTAWSVAALQPPHLAAIIPWDAASDVYRECYFAGGIPSMPLTHNWMLLTGFGLGEIEDMEAGVRNHPTFDEYWQVRVADWKKVTVPTYAVSEWANNLHLRGTLEAWKQITSENKFLDINGGKEWAEFYGEWAFERQRAFFGEFLRGEDNGVRHWSPVRIALRDNGKHWTFRDEKAWPLARAQHRPYYLNASTKTLSLTAPKDPTSVQYSTVTDERLTFDLTFTEYTEITGHSKLHLWIAADGSNDADVFVAYEKLDRNGNRIPFIYSQMQDDGPAAFGWLRASHRALDEKRSTPEQPWHTHQQRQWLVHMQPVVIDVEVWPTNIVFNDGETLRLVIKGSEVYQSRAGFSIRHAPTNNDGNHIIYAGGQFGSYLLLPIVD